jgi:hypothetical protein
MIASILGTTSCNHALGMSSAPFAPAFSPFEEQFLDHLDRICGD